MSKSATLRSLSERIYRREVVFFVGAGCSIDSEGNSARRLMMRLVIRFRAMLDTVLSHQNFDETKFSDIGGLASRFETTFGLKATKDGKTFSTLFSIAKLNAASPEECETTLNLLDKAVGKLAFQYYESNDWFCSVYQRLLFVLGEIQKTNYRNLIKKINTIEEDYRKLTANKNPIASPLDSVAFEPIDPILMKWAINEEDQSLGRSGKALFLDTLGFADEQLMGGKPQARGKELASSFTHKLLPRHHVMARFAREGLCPTVITTNYDMLLDGAWRTAGFQFQFDELEYGPRVPIPCLARIATPHDYQVFGKAVDTALLVKVHGCADQYRAVRKRALDEQNGKKINLSSPAMRKWAKYLDSVVFTYREIQNWRSDSWSRDLLANLQRTRSVAFVGYSLQDPVIHDSFRTVYEQMAQAEPLLPESPQIEHTPAYFFGQADKQPFYAMEVLSSATRATGQQPEKFNDHPNYVGFNFRESECPAMGAFPNLDDVFLWLNHQVTRKIQLDCLQNELSATYQNLLRKVLLPVDKQVLVNRFKEMVAAEEEEVGGFFDNGSDSGKTRHGFEKITGWTYWFHPRLLREFAISQWIDAGPGYEVNTLRESEWYFPLTARRDWTAWAAVVELAIYSLMTTATEDAQYRPVRAGVPAIVYQRNGVGMGNELLTLQVGDFERSGPAPIGDIAVGFECMWELQPKSAPWKIVKENQAADDLKSAKYKRPFGRTSLEAPSAELIWNLAVGQEESVVDTLLGDRALDVVGDLP